MTKPIQISDLSKSTVQSIETLFLPPAVAAPLAGTRHLAEQHDIAAEARTAAPPPSVDAPLLTYWVAG